MKAALEEVTVVLRFWKMLLDPAADTRGPLHRRLKCIQYRAGVWKYPRSLPQTCATFLDPGVREVLSGCGPGFGNLISEEDKRATPDVQNGLAFFLLFSFILFYSLLFSFILFYSLLFSFILFYSLLFSFILKQ